jgi:hypothetical protein
MKLTLLIVPCVLLVLCLGAHAQHGPVIPTSMKTPDELINLLVNGDELQRADARQWLRRLDVGNVHRLMPLISHESEHVWRAAYNVLADVASKASVPGREADREVVVGQIMTLLSAEQPAAIKERGLRLLAMVVPEGYDLAPVAALLADEALREKARTALEDAGTTEARTALRGAVAEADAPFQAALLNSLAMLHDTKSYATAAELLSSPDEAVQAAAARVLAHSGQPQHAAMVWEAYTGGGNQNEALGDALLGLVQTMVHNGNWEIAMNGFRELLKLGDGPLQGAALAGLGRYGDETAVADLIAVAQDPNRTALHGPAMTALAMLQGPAAAAAMREAYPTVQGPLRENLLYLFAGRQDASYLEALALAAEDGDPAVRAAAVEALSGSHLAGAVDVLAKRAGAASGDEKTAAVAALARVSLALRAQNDGPGSGKAALQLYQLATTEEQKAAALEGIRQHPVPEAFEVIMTTFSEEERAALPLETWAGIAGALHAAGRTEEAKQTFAMVLAKGPVKETLNQVIDLAGKLGTPELVANLGFVRKWSVAEPQPWKPADGMAGALPEGEQALSSLEGAGPNGVVDLPGKFGTVANRSVFAYAEVTVPEAVDAVARMGSDDGIALWVNGKKVHENNIDRGAAVDQDEAPVHLEAGVNHIAAQITQGGGGWNFMLRFTRPDGTPLQFTEGAPQ